MELNIKFTLSDRLFALLEDKLPNLGRRIDRAIGKGLGAQARKEFNTVISLSSGDPESEPADSAKQQRARRKKADTPEVVQEVEEPEPITEEPTTETSAQPAVEKEPTEEDIRAAMHRTRQRFEGEDYKENTGSETYKKYHKQLTGMFKQIAAVLGADKPSTLPADTRAAFIAECDALILDDNGFITPPPAPY